MYQQWISLTSLKRHMSMNDWTGYAKMSIQMLINFLMKLTFDEISSHNINSNCWLTLNIYITSMFDVAIVE